VRLTSSTLNGSSAKNRYRNDSTAIRSSTELRTTISARDFFANGPNNRTANSDGLGSQSTFTALCAFTFDDDLLFNILSHLLFDVTLTFATLVGKCLLFAAIIAVLQVHIFSAKAERRSTTRAEDESGDKRGYDECKVFHWRECENTEK